MTVATVFRYRYFDADDALLHEALSVGGYAWVPPEWMRRRIARYDCDEIPNPALKGHTHMPTKTVELLRFRVTEPMPVARFDALLAAAGSQPTDTIRHRDGNLIIERAVDDDAEG